MKENKARITPYNIVYHYHDDDLDTNTCYIHYFENENEMYRWAAKFFAFEDLDTGMEIDAIYNYGREIIYAGWQPDMLIEFIDKWSNTSVWAEYFPEWNH